jgi:hypothetical protein
MVQSTPPRAQVSVKTVDGSEVFGGTAPVEAKLPRRKQYVVTVSLPGFRDASVHIVEDGTEPWFWGNNLWGLGYIIDVVTGARHKVVPRGVAVVLFGDGHVVADGGASVPVPGQQSQAEGTAGATDTPPRLPAGETTGGGPAPPTTGPTTGNTSSWPELCSRLEAIAPNYTTVASTRLSPQQIALIAKAFGVDAGSVRDFRWGRSMAPVGHPDAGTTRYLIHCVEGQQEVVYTLRVGPSGVLLSRR